MFRLTRPASPPLDNVNSNNDNGLDNVASCRQQALSRSSRKLAHHHPNVKTPQRFEEKSKEEQIQRCCDRFKSYPTTVDTLIRALSTISRNPLEGKYRRIEQTNPGYQRSLANVPGAEQLLLALGFAPVNSQTLYLHRVNRQLLSLALSTLEQTKETPEYQQSKKELVFSKEVTAQLRATPTEDQQRERMEMLSKLPREPPLSRGAVIMIQLNDNDNTLVSRRFDGDDTFADVLNWVGGTVGSTFLGKLYTTRQWSLVDVNRQGNVPIDCQASRSKTLQHLGFWPSGRLDLRPSTTDWIQGVSMNVEMGVSRGLGSPDN